MTTAATSIEAAAEVIRADLATKRPPDDGAEAEFIACAALMAAWGLGWTKAILEDGADVETIDRSRAALTRLQLALSTLGAARCRFTIAAAAMMHIAEIVEAAEALMMRRAEGSG